jgi:hypothetical protein
MNSAQLRKTKTADETEQQTTSIDCVRPAPKHGIRAIADRRFNVFHAGQSALAECQLFPEMKLNPCLLDSRPDILPSGRRSAPIPERRNHLLGFIPPALSPKWGIGAIIDHCLPSSETHRRLCEYYPDALPSGRQITPERSNHPPGLIRQHNH